MSESALRFGHVTEYDPSRHMARVNFPDLGITSHWLPVLTHNTLKNHDETHLDVGEHVACMMAGNGAEMGVILGAFYDDKNTPPVGNSDIRAVTFDDNTRITYDRKHRRLYIDAADRIDIMARNADIDITNLNIAGKITLSGDVTLSGNVSCPGYCHCGG